MSTHNICFYGEITKIIPKLSSNTLLICSTDDLDGINIKCPKTSAHYNREIDSRSTTKPTN